MKFAAALLSLLAAGGIPGCGAQEAPRIHLSETNAVESGGLAVSIRLSKEAFTVGEKVSVLLKAYNLTNRPISIEAASGALVFVKIWRHTGLGWEQLKCYPQSAVMALNPWTLAPRSERNFSLQLTVEPDWPVGELVRITGELNGWPDASAGVIIEVSAAAKNTE